MCDCRRRDQELHGSFVSQGARLIVRARYTCLDNFTTLDVCIQQRLAVSLASTSHLYDL